ncbi:hypothetical protein FCL40_02270 [Ferrimonas sediminicola]|uniref:Uncharacterized protein n=1 Tax=Ferrimonas sediminicola TaxID=2569538 RepID=A0A4U1BIV3_9GAMM|nr:DUF5692 family protein [Ferrimonas sediminicola]TKB51400.1 hypothetical protein FCL40_02270 [Ferrimonas sediminicola]
MKSFLKLMSAWLLALVLTPAVLANELEGVNIGDQFAGQIWQGTMDGDPGQGSLFFRLEFSADHQVTVTRQSGGHNQVEVKQWQIQGEQLVITGSPGQMIDNFDEATMTVVSADRFHYAKDNKKFIGHKWIEARAYGHVLFVLIGLMVMNEICRRYKWPTVIIFFVLPIVLIPLWASYGVSYWFKWVKLYSVVGACVLFTLIRYTRVGEMRWAKFCAAGFLALNISEAVLQDFSMGYTANVLNAIGGIFSIITLTGWAQIQAAKTKERDMIWPAMTTFWIIAYDVWNFAFVYLNFPGSATAQFMVLTAATIPSLLITRGTWLQARAFTLALSFMYYFTNPAMYESNVVMLPRNDELMLAVGLLSFVLNSILFYQVYGAKWRNYRLKQEMAS